ncbi:cofactor FMO1 FAD enzyme [Colletotrichum acutatum]
MCLEILDEMAFDEGQEFELLTTLSEDDGPKQEIMSDFQPEPAQLVNFNADALSADQVYSQMLPELPTGGSVSPQAGCGIPSASNAL